MNKVFFFFVIFTVCLNILSCKQEQSGNVKKDTIDVKKAKAFIDSINLKFTEQIKNGDSAALASHYWPDAELLLDNSEPVKGKDILTAWGSIVRMGIKDMTFTTTDITVSGNLLVETGSYEMKDAKQTLIDKGKYIVVWKQQNGELKLFRDIGCTSLPAATK
ncbi:MAG: YybH family protein [Sphingobacteriales bacterium]